MSIKPVLLVLLLFSWTLAAIGQAAQSPTDAVQQYLRDAQQDLQQKQLDLAIPQFKAALADHAIEIDPTNYAAHYRLSSLDRQERKLEDAKSELAQYQKYKDMKAKLQSIFHEMRVRNDDNPEGNGGMGK